MKPRPSPLRRTPLRRVSKKRAQQLREYSAARKVFLAAHPICEVWCAENGFEWFDDRQYESAIGTVLTPEELVMEWRAPAAVECHHKAGRTGPNFLDQSTWLAVSQEAHRRIHDRPGQARAKGWLV